MEKMKQDVELLSASPLMDSSWYREQYPDVDTLQMRPAEHYLRVGAEMRRNPSPQFDTAYYIETNPDVADSAMNPLVHYLRFGRREGRPALRPVGDAKRDVPVAKAMFSTNDHSHIYLSGDAAGSIDGRRIALCATVDGVAQADIVRAVLPNFPCNAHVFLFAPSVHHSALRWALAHDCPHVELIANDDMCGEVDSFLQLVQRLQIEGVEIVCRLAQGQRAIDSLYEDSHALLGSQEHIDTVLAAFAEEPGLAAVGAITQLRNTGSANGKSLSYFAGGSMWARTTVFANATFASQEKDGDAGVALGTLVTSAGLRVGVISERGAEGVVVDARSDSPLMAAAIVHAEINRTRNEQARILISSLDAFDASYYAQQTKEPQLLGMDPVFHYVAYGETMCLDPAPWFSSRIFRSMHRHLLGESENAFHVYLTVPNKKELLVFPSLSNYGLIASILAENALVDTDYYVENNADVKTAGADPMRHYCRYGWIELRRPNAWFDSWWYGVTYMGELDGVLNPLLHYALLGKAAGHTTAPAPSLQNRIGTGFRYDQAFSAVRRVALYAAYDVDGIVDEYVLAYLRTLSQVADVYYLADSDMPQSELDKLAPYVKGAWARRHQTYDFGSYSLLAREFVGWDVLDTYDELVLANDSCYLVGDLVRSFETMHARQCDWWGLQATKGIAATAHVESNQFGEKIPLATVKSSMLSSFEQNYLYDFHVGSYFLCYRKPVMQDEGFRDLLNSVAKQRTKKLIIQRYEIGFTKYLINSGFEFDTLIDDLYPFHPIFTETHFELIARGFPLLKRYLISENHYRVSDLYRWKEWLLAAASDAPVALIENNLLRAINNEKLYSSLHVTAEGRTQKELLLSDEEVLAVDGHIEKDPNWWVFPVCGFNHTLGGNERAVFEHVKNDPTIKKIILTRSRHVSLEGENVVSVPIRSVAGQQYLLRSKVVFVKHTPTRNAIYPLNDKLRHFINLWHGIPLKRIGAASLDQQARLDGLYGEHRRCRSVIASSKIDQMAMASAFYPLTYNDVWITGLPRNDFVVCNDGKLPRDMSADVESIRTMLGGRRLVFYAPTFRNAGENNYYAFSDDEKRRIRELLDRHHCVLGIREHLADKTRSYSAELAEIGAINLGDKRFSNIEIIYRCADVLVTDYSSCFIDFLLTGKPVLSFAYDYDRYISEERGLFYDMEMVFPGPICKTFDALYEGLQQALEGRQGHAERYGFARSIFFDYVDDNNSERLVARVKSL